MKSFVSKKMGAGGEGRGGGEKTYVADKSKKFT